MKKTIYLAAAAALLMASTAAHAGSGYTFEIQGQKIHIEAPRNCNSLSCISVTNNGAAINLKNKNLTGKKSDGDVATTAAAPAPQPVTAPAVQTPPPAPVASNAPPAPAATYAPPAPPAPAAEAPRERLSGLPNNVPTRTADTPPVAPAAPAPVANNAPPAQQAAPVTQASPPAQTPTTPIGVWQTEDNKGNIRIEACGANLCGFADKTNERILVNMKPSDNKWVGHILDPENNSDYDSTISMKGPNLLKVQGCAFGGLFCGGQTWKRIS